MKFDYICPFFARVIELETTILS